MALGSLTYKTPVKIAVIEQDLTAKAGFIVQLTDTDTVDLCVAVNQRPFGVVTVGAPSIPGTYPGQILAGALEIVDAYGAVIPAIAGGAGVSFGSAVSVTAAGSCEDNTGGSTDWIVGFALSSAAAGESFLLQFMPMVTP